MTSTEYRLKESDAHAILERIAECVAGWGTVHLGDVLALQRSAANAIGCTRDDLRNVKTDWIDHAIGDATGRPIPAGMTMVQHVAVVALCDRYRAPFVDSDLFRSPFDLPAGYIAGTVAGIHAGVSPQGYLCT